ncbi:GRIP1-associated protein 1 isoform X2 [Calonectris borealis]|uniref:GRIP1-associated protein 1 isoform X2 n=1 Tax=Calonectris borealis TaxID=1323832 RepID=UPI003F4C13CE
MPPTGRPERPLPAPPRGVLRRRQDGAGPVGRGVPADAGGAGPGPAALGPPPPRSPRSPPPRRSCWSCGRRTTASRTSCGRTEPSCRGCGSGCRRWTRTWPKPTRRWRRCWGRHGCCRGSSRARRMISASRTAPCCASWPSCVRRSRDWKRRTGGCGTGGPQDPPVTPQPPWSPPRMGPLATAGPPRPLQMAEVAQLQAEVAKLTEELRKKQESFLQLQAEKEILLRDSRTEAEELRARRDEEFRELQAQNQRLQQELETMTQAEVGLRERSGALARELQEAQAQRDALDAQFQACAGERDGLRRRLAEAENARGESERGRQQAQEQLERQAQEHAAAARARAEQHRAELEGRVGELQAALGDAERQRELQEAEGRALRQELKDVRDGQRILEKKGSAALKDLKRQLQLERRRADRLQERLQELLAPTRARTGLEELGLEGGSPGRGPGGDSSSLSSLGRDGSAPGSTKSGSGSPGGGSGGGGIPGGGGLSPAEVAELFQRLAQSQQERWLLEEKVRHLEVSSASMAEDLCRKSAIIQSFVRDSRLEAAGPPGPPRRGVGPGEEGLREMNKKLQNMLEEQLTKNLHLGQDLEALSQELARLSKERAAPP